MSDPQPQETHGGRPRMPGKASSEIPRPGDRVRLVRHGQTVTAVVMRWDCEWFPTSFPVTCSCHGQTTTATPGEVTRLGSGPPS